jgi:outer membrane protein TolC
MRTLILSTLLISGTVLAQDKDLDNLIKLTKEKSLALEASKENLKAAQIEKERSAKHWLPQVYLSGQSFVTNDPGTSLFSKMSQRKITANDFAPDDLNHPSTDQYSKLALGVNLPLYEGGQKSSIKSALTFAEEAKRSEDSAVKIEFYNEVVKNYIAANNLKVEKSQLVEIYSMIDSVIKKYEIGNKSNPIGYSGLLGLKSLKNRLNAQLEENNAKSTGVISALSELAGSNVEIKVAPDFKVQTLMNDYLAFDQKTYKVSKNVEAMFFNAQSAKEIIGAEKSRNLPRIGLFGEGYGFNGERGTGKGFSTGIYINWNLFSGSDVGASTEALHKSHAAQYFAEANAQKEKMKYEGLLEGKLAVEKSLKLLDESENFLEEQTKISHNLFKNGLINALQYVEVLSRRVDLIKSKSQALNELLNIQAELAKLSSNNNEEGVTK